MSKTYPTNFACFELSQFQKAIHYLSAYGVYTSDGKFYTLELPTAEIAVNPDEVRPEEKLIHSNFFDGRSSARTRDRYLKMRNYIIESWWVVDEKCLPVLLFVWLMTLKYIQNLEALVHQRFPLSYISYQHSTTLKVY